MARRDAWYQALDRMAELSPRAVVASHKDPTRPDSPSDIDETRRYLDAVGVKLLDGVVELGGVGGAVGDWPDRVNPWAIWLTALRLFSE